jgi:hypothetical protein
MNDDASTQVATRLRQNRTPHPPRPAASDTINTHMRGSVNDPDRAGREQIDGSGAGCYSGVGGVGDDDIGPRET